MARMNRLFGVTMAERGVSQLVSVDLEGRGEAARGELGRATPPTVLPPPSLVAPLTTPPLLSRSPGICLLN